MPINTGEIEMFCAVPGGSVTATFYYDPVLTDGEVEPANQPIRNVNGAALRVVNTSQQDAVVRVEGPAGKLLGADGTEDVRVPPGGLTLTANQLRSRAGIRTRADIGAFSLQST